MAIEKQEFRRVLGHFAAGVTVVTTRGADGMPYGLTATAFTSVSLEPPLVLVCIDKRAESHPHFLASRVFTVNFLTLEQEEISRHFATTGGNKFANVGAGVGATGAPVLPDTLGHLDCRTVTVVDAGDHTIFVGEVEAGAAREAEPLLHFRGAYRCVG